MSQFDKVVFGKKKFSDILEEIYDNQKKKDKQITALINELKPMIEEIGDETSPETPTETPTEETPPAESVS